MQPGSSSSRPAALRRAQAPAAARQRGASVAMLLLVALLAAALSGADAALSVCAAVKPVCPAKAPPNPFDAARKPMSKQPVVKTAAAASPPAAAAAAATSPRPVQPHDVTASLLSAMGSRKERMFIPHLAQQQQSGARGRPAADMPQRVLPSGIQPAMSAVAQQQLFSQLLGVLQGPAGINTSSSSSKAGGGSLKPARRHRKRKTPATTAVMVSSVHELQQDSSEPGVVFLSNARLRVGIDTNRGGALTHLSSPVMPPEWANVNLINTWDSGRLVQQSYYGCYDGTCWVDRPWRWNPVQGGSWQNGPPQLLASSVGAASVTTASVPRNWGGQELLEDVLMVTQTQLTQNVVKVRFTMRYSGTALHPEAHQELPAVFVHRRLNVLALHTGSRPWTNEPLTFVVPGQVGEYYAPTERWAAYVDQATGFGVGVYSPVSDQLVAYRIGPEGSTARSDVSYMAPLVTARIQPNTEFSYDVYLAAGRVDEMRGWFADIAGSMQAAADAAPYIRAVEPPPADAAARVPSVRRDFLMDGTAARSEGRSGDGSVSFIGSLPTPAALVVDSHLASPTPTRVKVGQKPADLKPKARRAPPLVKPWAASPGQPGGSSSTKDKGAANKGSSSSSSDKDKGTKGSKAAAAAPPKPPTKPPTKPPPKAPAPAVAGKEASKSPHAAAVGVAAVGVAAATQPAATQPAAKRARTRHIAGASRSSRHDAAAAAAGHRSGPRDPSEPGGRPHADVVILTPSSAPKLAHASVHPALLQGSAGLDLPHSSTSKQVAAAQATAAAAATPTAAGAHQQPKPAAEEREAVVHQQPVQDPEVVKRGLAVQPAAPELHQHQQPASQEAQYSRAQASADSRVQQQQQHQQEQEGDAFEAAASRAVAAARGRPQYPQGRRSQHMQPRVTVQQTAHVQLGTQQPQQHGMQRHGHDHHHDRHQQQQARVEIASARSADEDASEQQRQQQRLAQLFSAFSTAATTLINKASSSEAFAAASHATGGRNSSGTAAAAGSVDVASALAGASATLSKALAAGKWDWGQVLSNVFQSLRSR